MPAQILVDGLWLATVGAWGDLKYSHVADGGCEQASWEMSLPHGFTHPAVHPGAVIEIREGSSNVWAGALNDRPNQQSDGTSFSAAGLAADLGTDLCLDGSGNTTTKPDTAIDRTIADGRPVTRPASLSNASFAASDDTIAINKIGDLLNAWSDSANVRWGVDADRVVYKAADPTTPRYYLAAEGTQLGLAEDDYWSDLYGRYQSGPNSYATVHASDSLASAQYRKEQDVDLTSYGIITSFKAQSIVDGLIAKGKARFALTEPLTVSSSQLTTPGGTPVYLPFVKGQEMVRAFGVVNEQGIPLPYYDFIIGRTEHVDGSGQITLSPVNLADRRLGDVLATAVGK